MGTIRFMILSVAVAAAVFLTSCTPSGAGPVSGEVAQTVPASPESGTADSEVSAEAVAPTPAPPAAPSVTPSAVPAEPDTAKVASAVEASLQALTDSQDAVTREQVGAAMERGFADAGVVPDLVEVSIDQTPTGLDVDAIQGAGLIGASCVFGEVREGAVSAVVLPVLASGRCFVGNQG